MMHLSVFEIDNPLWSEQNIKLTTSIPAAMTDSLLQLDITDRNKSYMKFQFRDNDSNRYLSKVIRNMDQLQEVEGMYAEKFLIHKDINEKIYDDSIPSNLEYCWINMELSQNNSESSLFLEQLFFHTKSQKLQIYPKFMVVNRTLSDLLIMPEEQRIKAKSNEILIVTNTQTKVRIGALYYKDSQEIDLNQPGLTGIITLQSNEPKSKKQLLYSVSVTYAPAPYSKTLLLTVTPRHVIVNMLEKPVLVQQFVAGQTFSPIMVHNTGALQTHELHLQSTP